VDSLAARTGWFFRYHLGPWLAVVALTITAGLGGALLVVSLEDTNPIQRTKLIAVEPPDRRIDRDVRRDFFFVREVCSSRDETLEVIRTWSEVVPDDQVRPTMGGSVSFFEAKAGCFKLKIRQPAPMSLPPGQYVFDIVLRRCSGFGQCESHRTEPIFIALMNGPGWPKSLVGPPAVEPEETVGGIVPDPPAPPPPLPPTP
jgi:hypothetical protein